MPAAYSLQPEVQAEIATCSGTLGCLEAIGSSAVVFLLWLGLLTELLFAPWVNVRAALSAIQTEYDAITAEQEALTSFVTRVEELPAGGPTPTVGSGGVSVVVATNSQPGAMAEVRDAYQETLMAVDHYDRDYGEPLAENLANELGDGIAGTVLSNDSLSPQVKRVLINSAQNGYTSREQYLGTLDSERTCLEAAGESLEEVASCCADADGSRLRLRSFSELQDRYDRLQDARGRLTATLERRQEQLQEGVTFGWQRRDSESVYRYLYRDIDAIFPVLADGTRLLERIETVESRVTTALTSKG